jgi:hypothetical protein
MNKNKILLLGLTTLLLSATMTSCNEKKGGSGNSKTTNQSISKETLKNEAWHMEELYWKYVEKNDTVNYKNLWHNDFIGYPSEGDGTSDKSKIAVWIPELHKDTSQTFSYKLYKKAVNPIDDVVIVFYDADQISTNRQGEIVKKETFKITHTWKKYGDSWLILGGMAARKL